MVEHLEHSTAICNNPVIAICVGSLRRRSHCNAQNHKAHVAHRGVSHQSLKVVLSVRSQRAQYDRQQRQNSQHGRKVSCLVREQRQDESQQTVATQLKEHPR